MATDRDALTMALARIRWQCHGQRDTVLGDDIPTADATIAAIEAALAAPPVEQQAAAPCVFHSQPWTGCKSCERHKAARAAAQPAPRTDTVPIEEYRRLVARCVELGEKLIAKQPAPQAGAAEHLWSLVEAYSSARIVACDPASTVAALSHAHARMLRMEVTLRQAFAARPTEQPAPQAGAAKPVLFVSAGQVAAHTDPDHPESGRYLPARKTSAGKFTMPLYAAEQPSQDARLVSLEDADLLEQAIEEFLDTGETMVSYDNLLRFAGMGLLECTHFTPMPKARQSIAEARAAQAQGGANG